MNLEFEFARRLDWEPCEQVVWMGRSSLWNWWQALGLAGLAAGLGLALILRDLPPFAPAGGFAAAGLLVATALRRLSRLYTVTNQRVIAQKGIFSRRVTEVELRDIRNINLGQSFFQRLVGIGDVEIASAGISGVEVRFQGIPGPEEVKEKIRQMRLAAGGVPG